jgi:hypothetical protein
MRFHELTEARIPSHVRSMSDTERHEWLKFIHDWLVGHYMSKYPNDASTLAKWKQLAVLFPPKVPGQVMLFRLVTVPIALAKRGRFSFRPALNPVSSWSKTLVGLDSAAGIALDQADSPETARVGIEASVPGDLVLATTKSLRDAFMSMSHDYFDRYHEVEIKKNNSLHMTHPGYPGGDDDNNVEFNMDEVGFLQDVMSRRGGAHRQYEYVVETPAKVDATVVQIYRMGKDHKRMGNDDPHQGRSLRITRMKN